ncbi:MAG: MATE family efflux transporter [Mogibacterium sp.]|nr:MATE family efflux transporter [Mogibacterium sp.]
MDNEKKGNRIDLLNGKIAGALFWLSLPIMGSQFANMAYNLFDTMWVGQLGNQAVTAVGAAGTFMWIGSGFAMIPQIGGQVMAGQSIGEGNMAKARSYARAAVKLMLLGMLTYGLICIAFRHPLISFYHLHDPETAAASESYLAIVSLCNVFMGLNIVMEGLLAATGDSRTSFKYNLIGTILNIVLDPVLIFGVGPFPALGVNGAAIATVFSEFVVSALFALNITRDDYLFAGFSLFGDPAGKEMLHIIKLGAPPAVFNIVYAFISMVISRIIVSFGDAAIAIQRIGGQIESLTWMTAEGFSYSMSAFISQNYGAESYGRVKKGFYTGTAMMTVFGIAVTALLVFGAAPIFSIFIKEPELIAGGATYLRIVGLSELFMSYELATTGSFNGLGQTRLPAAIGLVLTVARIPLCYILMPVMGINGVWWAMTISSILKGTLLIILFIYRLRKLQ